MPSVMKNESKLKKDYGVININRPWEYKPWIRAKELCTGKGRRHVIRDLKHPNRMIHLFSDLELDVYCRLRNDQRVLELFEQYPLDRNRTLQIGDELGIVHPRIPGTDQYTVMTTDFLAIVKGNKGPEYRAYSVKYEGDLIDQRTLEKLKIEQLYWERLNIPWALFTEKCLN